MDLVALVGSGKEEGGGVKGQRGSECGMLEGKEMGVLVIMERAGNRDV